MAPKNGTMERTVYDLIAAAPKGLTADQVEELTGWNRKTVSARISTLKACGIVVPLRDEDGGLVRRVTRTGGLAHVMVLAG